jgi:putative heme-binding domain-containing protein
MLKRFAVIASLTFINASAQDAARLELLVATAAKMDKAEVQASLLKGMKDSLSGQRGVAAPKGWAELAAKLKDSPDADVRARVQELSVIFGGGAAMDEMRAKLADAAAPFDTRKQALDSLVAQKDGGALDTILKLSAEAGPLREPALRGLAGFDDSRIAPMITAQFGALDSAERRAALQTLLARISGAKAFLAAVDSGAIPKGELSAPIARQLDGLKDPEVAKWLSKNWGAVSAPNEDKQKLIAKFKEFTSSDAIARADASRGRALYAQTCAVCHTMFGTGGHIGPELTGGYGDVDYLLNNILDPNALIGKDYQQTFVKTKDGQTVAGIVTQDTDAAVTLKNLAGEVVTLQKSDVASTEISPLSMMPEGLITSMDEESVRDLFHYLAQKQQVPMLLTGLNANDFFNGADFRNWRVEGDWKIAGGEIVAPGGEKPATLQSEMLLGEGKLTFSMKMSGDGIVEIALAGTRVGGSFSGETLSAGGSSSMNIWTYSAGNSQPVSKALGKAIGEGWRTVSIERSSGKLVLSIDGTVVHESQTTARLAPAFHLLGRGSELRIKDLRVEAK